MPDNVIQNIFVPGYDEVKVSTGKLAKNADSAVLVEAGAISLLATVVFSKKISQGDYLPLLVEYRERSSSIGKIPAGFVKRETKLTDREILISRLVDRTLRPMFDKNFRQEVHVCIHLLSATPHSLPENLVCFAASLALSISELPFNYPVANVSVARLNNNFIVNPDLATQRFSLLNITVGGNKHGIVMLEGNMDEIPNPDVARAISVAQETIVKLCEFQENFASQFKVKKLEVQTRERDAKCEELKALIKNVFLAGIKNKNSREARVDASVEEFKTKYPDLIFNLDELKKEVLHEIAFDHGCRVDGRRFDEIREINCEVDVLPAAHGSALFTRGGTQALANVTLGSKMDEFLSDSVLANKNENFVVHYNFYGFATGEIRSLDKKVSRRELGHGTLATKALQGIIPNEEQNPFTIRVVSDILESDGSSSMATVCAGTLAMMDAGCPMKNPVAGIAMGFLVDMKKNKCLILTDISSDEDAYGDMDFKVAGSKYGLTALQLDTKIDFIPVHLVEKIFAQAHHGLLSILDKMLQTLPFPREKTKSHAPVGLVLTVPKNVIGAIIGANGKVIQGLQRSTGAVVNIIERETYGVVRIFGSNASIAQAAEREIHNIIAIQQNPPQHQIPPV